MAIRSVTTMSFVTTVKSFVSSSIMSPAIFISPSAIHSIPVEKLERPIALVKEELRNKKLDQEFQKLKVITSQYSVNVAPLSSPSISVAPLASCNGVSNSFTSNRVDLPRLQSKENMTQATYLLEINFCLPLSMD